MDSKHCNHWTEWSSCTVTCGSGSSQRFRQVVDGTISGCTETSQIIEAVVCGELRYPTVAELDIKKKAIEETLVKETEKVKALEEEKMRIEEE